MSDPRPLKVCQIVATTQGAHWVFEQLRGLRDRHGFDVTAIVSGAEGPLVDQLRSANIRFLAADFSMHHGNVARLTRQILDLARTLRRERFDVVQTHVFPTMLIGRFAAWLADVPLRLAMIAGPFHLQAEASRVMDRDTCFMDDVLIGSCELTCRLYRQMGISEDRLALVYYGPDNRRFEPETTAPAGIREQLGWPAGAPVVGMVAYFYQRMSSMSWIAREVWGRGIKGHEDLVRAAAIVLRERPDTKFLVVGGAFGGALGEQYRDEIIALAHSLGLSSRIAFEGHRSDVPAILRDLDISVQPSLNENLGGTLESLFMERPMVATRVGGMVDSVRDGETGVLVAPGNPEDLARGILELLRDPQRARALGRAGRRLMLERFTLDRTVDDLAALYRRGRRTGFRLTRGATRVIAAAPLAAYLVARLRYPESRAFKAWDDRRAPKAS